MKRITLLLLIAVSTAISVSAAQPRPNWTKVELSWIEDRVAPIPVEMLSNFSGEDVADYGSFRIVYLPKGMLARFTERANAEGLRVRERDELDRIDAPSASVDVRQGIHPTGPGDLIRRYAETQTGLYLVQFAGPAKAEWFAALRDLGWTIAGYLPSDAYIVAGRPALAGRTEQLPFVQFFDFYHPFEKAARFARDGSESDVIVELPGGVERQQTVDAITRRSLIAPRVESYSNDVYVHARLRQQDAELLLSDPLVVAIDAEPVIKLSDERVALSLTSSVTTNGAQPMSPGTYAHLLSQSCGLCAPSNMPASTWRVGIADTGLDNGSGANATHHPDLAGREFWGTTFIQAGDPCGDCDYLGHGTVVAGIIAGNAATGLTDGDGYLDGQGVAPAAGIYSTKIFSSAGFAAGSNIFYWATDATSHGTHIQNHSHNDYNHVNGSTSGRYTIESRLYDLATRDSDNNSANGLSQILFTVSAGNIDQEPGTEQVLPPATAKNVIAAGGAENYRPAWADPQHVRCHGAWADGFININSNTRRGTTQGGIIKPDLVAPATIVVSTHTTTPTTYGYTDCYDDFDGHLNYTAESGTSFAAPVVAAASLLVKRYYDNPTMSPSAVKAFLIANARSIRGGVDHRTNLAIGAVPNIVQGFGRVSLDHAFSQLPVVYEQSMTRHFTTSGQTWRTRLSVQDTSQPVTVALVWTDAAGVADVTNPLVNDLDLAIYPATQNCTYFVGNNLNSTDESISYPCHSAAAVDTFNNVEYARFRASGYTQFDVVVTGRAITYPADPAFSANVNQDFALVVMNAIATNNGYPIQPQLTAHRNSSNPFAIDLSWTPPVNLLVDHYTINRGSTLTNVTATSNTTTQTAFTDSSLPAAINTWVYSVTASSPSPSPETSTSDIDFATTVQFHDVPVNSSVKIKAQHFTELRQAVDAIRVAGNKAPTSWTDPTLNGSARIKAVHMTQMRTQLANGLSAFGVPSPAYTYSIFIGQAIHALDVTELQNNIK